MKNTGKKIVYGVLFLVAFKVLFDMYGCTHDDVALDEYIPKTTVNETELISIKTTTAPSIDGEIDASWEKADALTGKAVVPSLGPEKNKENFNGYHGRSFKFSIKSQYDNESIYMLIRWDDNSESLDRETWYFDPSTKRWAQENRYPLFNTNNVMTRDGFYEDKFAFLWNVNNSVPDWSSKTCFASCHTGIGQTAGYARHYTNGPNERIDMWHWKRVREGFFGTFDDQYQDNTQPNGRKSDPKVTGTGYFDNKQTLTITGTSTTVSVPKYVIPDRTYYYWITQDEINNNTAKTITSVDANGVLYYSGGSIDPNTENQFQRDGIRVGPKGIPSIYNSKVQGNEGDITAKFKHTGSEWILELQRKLKTADTENVDVDFSSLQDQYFGIGIFENAAIAHAIKNNLVLKFKK